LDDITAQNQRNFRRLVVSLKASCDRLNLLLAIGDNWRYRDELIADYEAELTAAGVQCHRVTVNRSQPSLKDSLQALVAEQPELADKDAPTLVTVLGADELLNIQLSEPKSAQEQFFFSVQWTRESLRQFQFPLVIWLTPAIAANLAQQAPDFWSWRGGTFEFSRPIAQDVTMQLAGELELQLVAPDEAEPAVDPATLEAQIAELIAQAPDSPLLASLYNSLGEAYEQAIRYDEAETAYREALTLTEQQLGTEHSNVATSLNNLASLYYAQGRYSEAEPLFQQALALWQKLLGDDHSGVATSLNNLAELYRAQGRYSEAEPLYQQALALWQKLLGDDHPDVATSFNNLAAIYQSQGRYSEAEPLFQQALALRQKLLGDDHPDVASTLWNLGAMRYKQGQVEEAQTLLLKALPIYAAKLGLGHPNTKKLQSWIDGVQNKLAQ
jgi:tetratricopeptide (TPR) repeat protein